MRGRKNRKRQKWTLKTMGFQERREGKKFKQYQTGSPKYVESGGILKMCEHSLKDKNLGFGRRSWQILACLLLSE